jgi:hypothetical protein
LKTRADQLVHAPAFALRGIEAKGRAGTFSEEDRYAIAKAVVTGSGSAAIRGTWTASCRRSFTDHQQPGIDKSGVVR